MTTRGNTFSFNESLALTVSMTEIRSQKNENIGSPPMAFAARLGFEFR
jgi:hypothetical protein